MPEVRLNFICRSSAKVFKCKCVSEQTPRQGLISSCSNMQLKEGARRECLRGSCRGSDMKLLDRLSSQWLQNIVPTPMVLRRFKFLSTQNYHNLIEKLYFFSPASSFSSRRCVSQTNLQNKPSMNLHPIVQLGGGSSAISTAGTTTCSVRAAVVSVPQCTAALTILTALLLLWICYCRGLKKEHQACMGTQSQRQDLSESSETLAK